MPRAPAVIEDTIDGTSKEILLKNAPRENIFLDNTWASCTQPYFYCAETLAGPSRRASWDASKMSECQGDGCSGSTRFIDATDSATRSEDRRWSEPPQGYNPTPPFPFRQNLTASGHPDWGTAPTPKGAKHRAQTSRSPSLAPSFPSPRLKVPHSTSSAGDHSKHNANERSQNGFRAPSVRVTDPQGSLMGYIRSADQMDVATNNQGDSDDDEELLRSFRASLENGEWTSRRPSDSFEKDIPVMFPHERSNFVRVEQISQGWPMTF